MNMQDAFLRLQTLAYQFEEWRRPTFDQPVSSDELSLLNSRYDQIPTELKEFFTKTRQIVAMDVWNGYWIGGNVVFNPRPDDGFPKLGVNDDEKFDVMAIATDGGGNAFLFCLERGSVWKWDHETNRTRFVSDSLVQFLLAVADDWQHVLDEDFTWNYLT